MLHFTSAKAVYSAYTVTINTTMTINTTYLQSADVTAEMSDESLYSGNSVQRMRGILRACVYFLAKWRTSVNSTLYHSWRKGHRRYVSLGNWCDYIGAFAMNKHVCHMSNKWCRSALQTLKPSCKTATCPSSMISKGGKVPCIMLMWHYNRVWHEYTINRLLFRHWLCLNFILGLKWGLKSPPHNVYTGYL